MMTMPAMVRRDARPKDEPGRDQLGEVIEKDAAFQDAAREEMKPAAETVRHRLRFKVIEERGEISPALVAADFDHAGRRA